MCGIYGWQLQEGAVKKSQLNIIAAVLASENDRRGGDSWGLTYLDHKIPQTSRGLGLISKGTKAYRVAECRQVMAHTRRASTGAVTVENAHPFQIGKVIGAHNGVIYNYADLNKKYGRSCPVDSMHIFHHLKDRLDLQDLRGWGAIEYLKTDEPTAVYLGKFDQGELAIRGIGKRMKDSIGLVWSSEARALEKALSLAGVRSFEYKVEKQTLYKAIKGMLHQAGILPVSTSTTLTADERRMSEATGTFRGEGTRSEAPKAGSFLMKKAQQVGRSLLGEKAERFTCGMCMEKSEGRSYHCDGMPLCEECWDQLEQGEE